MTRLVWLQLELVATSLDLSWLPNSPLSPRPINTIKWISKEVPSSPCHRWRISALDTIYAPILRSPRFLQVTFPQLRMTAVTLAPFTRPISFPEAAILMHSEAIAWLVTCQCFPSLFTIAWLATCFPALFTIAWSLTSYALFAILYPVASFPALFIVAWLVTCFPAHFTMVYPITRFPTIFTIG